MLLTDYPVGSGANIGKPERAELDSLLKENVQSFLVLGSS
jgi:hypothetical protein